MRTIHLLSPPQRGPDVRRLQHDVNLHLTRWGALPSAMLKKDAVFGPMTLRRLKEVAHGCGVLDPLRHGVSPSVQRKVHNLRWLTPRERRFTKARAGWRKRYIRRLNGSGLDHAVRFALAMAARHVVERPSGSNLGPYITSWEKLCGYAPPIPWCGAFVNACLVAGGFPPQMWGIGYVPDIEAHAQAGRDGWKWHGAVEEPKRGWIATFGRGLGEHTEFVVEDGHPLRTVGGNTSAGDGSFNEGGGVYHHNFNTYQGYPVRGYAAPPWH